MALKDIIYRLRTEEKLSQARFAEIMGVSAQAVQKWESGLSVPELDKLIKIAHRFGVSLDSLALDRDMRAEEELPYSRKIHLPFSVSGYEAYSAVLPAEYRQCSAPNSSFFSRRRAFPSRTGTAAGRCACRPDGDFSCTAETSPQAAGIFHHSGRCGAADCGHTSGLP